MDNVGLILVKLPIQKSRVDCICPVLQCPFLRVRLECSNVAALVSSSLNAARQDMSCRTSVELTFAWHTCFYICAFMLFLLLCFELHFKRTMMLTVY